LPAAICARWQWNKGQEEWEEFKKTRCQYKGVLIPAMVAMLELGKEEGATRVQELGCGKQGVGQQEDMVGESRDWAGSSSVYDVGTDE
jgi:hypothetical protein